MNQQFSFCYLSLNRDHSTAILIDKQKSIDNTDNSQQVWNTKRNTIGEIVN